jgi:hypothetical protein
MYVWKVSTNIVRIKQSCNYMYCTVQIQYSICTCMLGMGINFIDNSVERPLRTTQAGSDSL